MNVPVLARVLEAEGLATVVVTNMPIWAEQIGIPRTLGVEFPYGHTLGEPGNLEQQCQVLGEALRLFEQAERPGVVAYSEVEWGLPLEETLRAWQPEEPSPIVSHLSSQIRELVRSRRVEDG